MKHKKSKVPGIALACQLVFAPAVLGMENLCAAAEETEDQTSCSTERLHLHLHSLCQKTSETCRNLSSQTTSGMQTTGSESASKRMNGQNDDSSNTNQPQNTQGARNGMNEGLCTNEQDCLRDGSCASQDNSSAKHIYGNTAAGQEQSGSHHGNVSKGMRRQDGSCLE